MHVCSLSYPACNTHAPYCHLWPVRLYYIFPRFLINGTILEKKYYNIKCVFWFSLHCLFEIFLIPRRSERDMIIRVCCYSCKVSVIIVCFNKTWIFSTNFRKILKYQISWKSVWWEPSCSTRTEGRADRRAAMTKLIVVFRSFAKAPNRRKV